MKKPIWELVLQKKIIKFGFTIKVAFNIGRSIIHSTLETPLIKSLFELGSLSDERCGNFAKKYGQLH
jgi:hypothetical protein